MIMWYKKNREMKQKHKYAPTYCIHNEGFPETRTHLKYSIRYGLAKGDLNSCIRCGQHCMFVLVISFKFPVWKKE